MTPHEVNTGSAHQTLIMKYLDHDGLKPATRVKTKPLSKHGVPSGYPKKLYVKSACIAQKTLG
jgi:hypothetical protein